MSTLIPLEDVRVASPCRADWNMMEGDERVRFCQSCAKHVYNLSGMSKADAEKLLQEKEGKLCVRYFQRADGTILTDNCPVGLKIVRRPFKWLAASFAALMASGAAIASQSGSTPAQVCKPAFDVRDLPLVQTIIARIEGRPPAVMGDIMVMGAPVPPPTPLPPPTSEE